MRGLSPVDVEGELVKARPDWIRRLELLVQQPRRWGTGPGTASHCHPPQQRSEPLENWFVVFEQILEMGYGARGATTGRFQLQSLDVFNL